MMTSLRKQITLCTIGTILEWYDFALFACLTPILSQIFFAKSSHLAAIMQTFAIFASGYIMRPVGALFFGHLGDTLGRKYTLLITIFSMTLATTAIGLIPIGTSFSTLGLVICRLIQGFATSGEYPGSLALLSEQHSQKHRAFIASLGIFGTGAGCFTGALVYAITLKILGYENMTQWGWRIPFLLGAPLGVFGYFLRKYIFESNQFAIIKQKGLTSSAPIIELFKKHFPVFLAMLSISILTNALVYINLLYFGSLALAAHKLDANSVMNLNLLVTFVYTIAILFFGFLSDYVNKKMILTIACALLVLLMYPLCVFILSQNVIAQFIAQGCISVLLGMVLGPYASILAESFPTAVRYTGLSVTLNIAASFFGGSAPMICGWLTKTSGMPTAPAFYIIILALFALSASLMILMYFAKLQITTTQPDMESEPRPLGSVTELA